MTKVRDQQSTRMQEQAAEDLKWNVTKLVDNHEVWISLSSNFMVAFFNDCLESFKDHYTIEYG